MTNATPHNIKKKSNTLTVAMLLVGLLSILLTSPISAQSPITARVDRNTLTIDEQVVLTVTVTGDFLKIPQPDLANLGEFIVVSSSTSTQVSIVNGQMTSQGVYLYRLQPLHEGAVEIGSIGVNIDGQLYQTDPIQLEVFAGGTPIQPPSQTNPDTDAPTLSPGEEFFVKAQVDNPNPFLGQQIIYTFQIYQASGFAFGQPDYTPPPFTDFWSQEIIAPLHHPEEINGITYMVTEIMTALFPANLGTITIEPASLVIPGSLLSPDIRLETEPVTVEVKSLPEQGKPEDFSGAVGQYSINANLSDSEVVINHPLTLRVTIEGTGNIQTLAEPVLPEMDKWRMFESKSFTDIDASNGRMTGTRTFERLVVPGQAGELTFEPISFSYYDPDAQAYNTISTEPIPVTVLPDDSQPALPTVVDFNDEEQTVNLLASDIRHIKPVPASLNVGTALSVAGQVVYWMAWIVPLFLVAGVQIWQHRQQRLQKDPAFARDQRAKRQALTILDEAKTAGSKEQAAAAGRALLGYLSDKLNKPTAGLTTGGLIRLLRESRLQTRHIERIEALLHQIDIGRFAPISAGDAESIIVETRRLIDDLEKSFSRQRKR
ncbi:MAG TPA: BatD family protein [Anaerolineae bacterium]|nr:BatD family protein [Anaerolineae bacterium]